MLVTVRNAAGSMPSSVVMFGSSPVWGTLPTVHHPSLRQSLSGGGEGFSYRIEKDMTKQPALKARAQREMFIRRIFKEKRVTGASVVMGERHNFIIDAEPEPAIISSDVQELVRATEDPTASVSLATVQNSKAHELVGLAIHTANMSSGGPRQPSLVVQNGDEQVAVWLFSTPILISDNSQRRRIGRLARTLDIFGGDVTYSIPLPGCGGWHLDNPENFVLGDISIFTLDQMEEIFKIAAHDAFVGLLGENPVDDRYFVEKLISANRLH